MIDLSENRKNNTFINIPSLGGVELKFISVGDEVYFEKLSFSSKSDKEFVINTLFHQLIQPKINIIVFQNISEQELKQLATAFIKNEDNIFEYYQDTDNLYQDFKKAIIEGNRKHNEELRKSIEPIIKSTQDSLRMFNKDFTDIIQQSLVGTSFIQDSLRELSEISSHIAADSQQMLSNAIKPILEQYQSDIKYFNELIQPQIDIWQKWSEQNKKIFDSFYKYWADFQKKYNIAEAKAAEVLQKYKWFITPSMPMAFVYKVITLDKEEGRQDKAINKLFIQYFKADKWKNLEVMVASWKNNPLFRKRYKILTDCLNTIKICSGKSVNVANVVLPILIIQIDGLIDDFLISKGIAISRNTSYNERKTKLKKNKSKILTTQLDDLANDIFLNILLQTSHKGKPLANPFNFNRHKILHGENTRYGRKNYLVRAFMILDLLAHYQ